MGFPVISGIKPVLARQDGFASSYMGGRWIVKNPTPGTGITGSTSLSRTAPFLIIRQAGESGTRALTLSTFSFTQVGTVAGGVITLLFGASASDLYSSGGTSVTPKNLNVASSVTQGFTARTGATASGGSSSDDIFEFQFAASTTSPSPVTINFLDSVRIGTTGSIVVYAFASTTAPTLTFAAEIIEGVDE
jgi:hypothetical protein